MRILGIILLVLGLGMGMYSLNMDVGVDMPAADYGNGVSTPAARVANVDRMEQRRNMTVFSGALVLGGIMLIGFSSIGQRRVKPASPASDELMPAAPKYVPPAGGHASITICPNCRSMHTEAVEVCKCGKTLT